MSSLLDRLKVKNIPEKNTVMNNCLIQTDPDLSRLPLIFIRFAHLRWIRIDFALLIALQKCKDHNCF